MDDRDAAPRGFSRRKFLQGAAGSAAASGALATLPALAQEAGTLEAVRTGLKRYEAGQGVEIALKVNGQAAAVTVPPQTTLLQALRETLNLTGAKEVCDRGACGACTVLVDGRSVNSCSLLAIDAMGAEITTIEGLKQGDRLDSVQQAFVEHDASQCGYCIPGFVMRSRALLDETPHPDRAAIQHGLCGNICRCAAYTRIIEAVAAAAGGQS